MDKWSLPVASSDEVLGSSDEEDGAEGECGPEGITL